MKKIHIYILMLVTALFLALCAACTVDNGGGKGTPGEDADISEKTVLSAPQNLTVSEKGLLSWDEVDGAELYIIGIEGKEYTTKLDSFDLTNKITESGIYTVTVCAGTSGEDAVRSEVVSVEYVKGSAGLLYELTEDGSSYSVKAASAKSLSGKVVISASYHGKPVTEVAKDAFRDCANITEIIVPDGVEIICSDAFGMCSALQSVSLPSSLKTIEYAAFFYCEKLTSIVLSEGLETIGHMAFNYCSALTSLEIPASVSTIGTDTSLRIIYGCDNLTTLTVNENNQYFESENNCVIRKADKKLLFACEGTKSVPSGIKSIGDYAFSYLSISTVVLPDGLTSIGNNAFYYCENISEVVIPYGCTEIGSNAFNGCSGLKTLKLPDGLLSVGEKAFYKCTYLNGVVIPESVTRIGESAFDATVYSPYAADPEGWTENTNSSGSVTTYKWTTTSVVRGCALGYENHYPYVVSWDKKNNSVSPVKVPERTGYRFLGWAIEPGATEPKYSAQYATSNYVCRIDSDEYKALPNDTTFYAVWEKIESA